MFKSVLTFLFLFWVSITVAQSVSDDTLKVAKRPHRSDTLKHQQPDTTNQKDLIDIAKTVFDFRKHGVKRQPGKKIYFSFLPSASSIPGGGTAIITSTAVGFYMGDRRTTNISNISFTPYYNLKNRYGLPIHTNIWLKNNNWLISGDTRFMVLPQYTWGLGGNTPEDSKIFVNYKYIRLYESLLRRITPYFLIGMGFDIDYRLDISSETDNITLKKFSGYGIGTGHGQNTFSSGPTINLLYDTRNNDLNPLPGVYASIIYRYNSEVFGSNRNWQSLYMDFRKYISLSPHTHRQNELALWTYYWTTLSSGAPYLDLPSTMWDSFNRSARGFEANRYRGTALIDAEAEYRRGITQNGLLGFVIFANANSVKEPDNGCFNYVHWAAGAGLRVKFNKNSNTNIGVDYGRSKYFGKAIFSIGEAF